MTPSSLWYSPESKPPASCWDRGRNVVIGGWEPDFSFLQLILHSCLAEYLASFQAPEIYCVFVAQISSFLLISSFTGTWFSAHYSLLYHLPDQLSTFHCPTFEEICSSLCLPFLPFFFFYLELPLKLFYCRVNRALKETHACYITRIQMHIHIIFNQKFKSMLPKLEASCPH